MVGLTLRQAEASLKRWKRSENLVYEAILRNEPFKNLSRYTGLPKRDFKKISIFDVRLQINILQNYIKKLKSEKGKNARKKLNG